MNRIPGRLAIAALLVSTLTGCQGVFREQVSDHALKTIPMSGAAAIELGTENGGIYISPYSGSELSVDIRMLAKASTREQAQEFIDLIEIRAERQGDRAVVSIDQPECALLGSTEASIRVRVPSSWEGVLSALTTNGPIEAEGLNADADLVTTNGNIHIEDWEGSVDAITTNGAVEASGISLTSHGTFRTTNGDVALALPDAPTTGIDMTSTNGSLALTVPRGSGLNLQSSLMNGKISVRGLGYDVNSDRSVSRPLNGGGPAVTLRTVSGNIRVEGH